MLVLQDFFGGLFIVYKRIVWGPVLRNARKVIVCSSEFTAVVEQLYGVNSSNISVIENAVSNDFFLTRTYIPPKDVFQLLFIGRLASQKRVERLIHAMELLTIPAELTIVGDGEDRVMLEMMVKEKELLNISFVGTKNIRQIQEYHQQSHALLIPSDREGSPLVLLEGMAAGLPIIGSNVVGIRGPLEDVGMLVDEPYAENFAKAITELYQNKEELVHCSKKGREKATQYTWEAFYTRLIEVYSEILT